MPASGRATGPRTPGPVWLVGMPGAGKSTVGRILAARLGRPFVDMDARIEAEAGCPIAALFAREGEPAFRAREAALVEQLAKDAGASIIATGGGAPCTPGSLAAMQQSGAVAWLSVTPDEALPALMRDAELRPLLAAAPRARWAALLEARRDTYAQAPIVVERRGRDAEAIAAELERRLPSTIEVALGDRAYPIILDAEPAPEARFAAHLARRLPPERTGAIGLVTDENVGRLHAPAFRAALAARGFRVIDVIVPAGERAKSLAQAGRVADALVAGGLDRRGVVVALGGGVVGDLAGFVASILFRGVACAQVPTTLLAMVDSSVGGKTGVNLDAGKNLVGTFHQPALVYAPLAALSTLPPRERRAGLGEIAKHALLDGWPAFTHLLDLADRAREGDPAALAELVADSCRLKARVVAGDEREQRDDGGRVLLNLGHTVGHALEAHGHRRPRDAEGPLLHGEAVALGLLAAARIGAEQPGAAGSFEAPLSALLARLGLPTDLDARLAEPGALDAIAVDKKRAGAALRYVALLAPGDVRVVPLPPARLRALLQRNNIDAPASSGPAAPTPSPTPEVRP